MAEEIESKKHPGGRPEKLTPEVADRILSAIRAGNYVETAVAFAGLRKDTFYQWLRRGAEQPKGIYREFSDAVKKAQAESETGQVATIRKASLEYWQAAAWILERRFPRKWGQKVRISVEEELREFVERLESRLPPDIFEKVLEASAGDFSGEIRAIASGENDADDSSVLPSCAESETG